MKKKSKKTKLVHTRCPFCGGQLYYGQDMINFIPIITKDGVITLNPDKKSWNCEYLDNVWLECSECHLTSEDDDVLESMFNNIQ
jgi:hypothetical protein